MKCPFLPQNITTWSRIVEDFDNKVTSIDAKAKNFVNDYFTRVRGTNNAFNLLERFKAVKARGAISCLLKDKYRDVLRSLGVEVRFCLDIFYYDSTTYLSGDLKQMNFVIVD